MTEKGREAKLIELEEGQKRKPSKYYNYEQSVKLALVSIYGAFGNEYFYFFNVDIAETITLQGKDAILYTEEMVNKYFREFWHKDTAAHQQMGIKVTERVKSPIGIYIDTDSIVGNSLIDLDNGQAMTIEDLYNIGKSDMGTTVSGHESVSCQHNVLNWSEDRGLYYAPVKRVIRHKVSKKKWRLKTFSGAEVIVTNDHSLIVFRDGIKTEVKPSEVKLTDQILVVCK